MLEEYCCREVDAGLFVSLINDKSFNGPNFYQEIIKNIVKDYKHLLQCKGCFERTGSYLEEMQVGNNRFNKNIFNSNLAYIEEVYKIK